jgi:SnoaL-like domain
VCVGTCATSCDRPRLGHGDELASQTSAHRGDATTHALSHADFQRQPPSSTPSSNPPVTLQPPGAPCTTFEIHAQPSLGMAKTEAKVMARTSTLPSRTHRTWLLAATIGTAVVVVAAVAAWALFARSSDNPARSVPAATSSSAASQGPRTDPWDDHYAVNEPALVVEGYVESLNRGDTAGALTTFAADAALSSPRCQPACIGPAAIAPELEQTAATLSQLTLTDPRVEGDTLTAHFSVASPELPAGVQRIIGTTTAVVRNQKIVLLSMDWDATDPQTAAALDMLNQH